MIGRRRGGRLARRPRARQGSVTAEAASRRLGGGGEDGGLGVGGVHAVRQMYELSIFEVADLWTSSTSGRIRQLHRQALPARDQGARAAPMAAGRGSRRRGGEVALRSTAALQKGVKGAQAARLWSWRQPRTRDRRRLRERRGPREPRTRAARSTRRSPREAPLPPPPPPPPPPLPPPPPQLRGSASSEGRRRSPRSPARP